MHAPVPAPVPVPARVPTVILGGWLGAGKTTLLNHLLRHADGRRIAVLVNDFGDVSIDADLIEGALADGVVALAGGCICCSFGADLVGTLAAIARRAPAPDVILVECSGVALPRSVARTAKLAMDIALEGIVTVVDAEQFAERAADPYVGDTVRAQAGEADLLIVNKADLADPAAARAAIARTAPGVPMVDAVHGQVAPDVVLGVRTQTHPPAHPRPRPAQRMFATTIAPPAPDAGARFETTVRTWDVPVDVEALARELAAEDTRLLRAKGVLTGIDGRRWVLHAVGRRVEAVPAGAPDQAGGRLVTIRLK